MYAIRSYYVIWRYGLTVGHLPIQGHLAAQLGKHLLRPGLAAEDAGLAGDDGGFRLLVGGDELGRDVGDGIQGAAQIFEQGVAHGAFNILLSYNFV